MQVLRFLFIPVICFNCFFCISFIHAQEIPDHAAYVSAILKDTNGNAVNNVQMFIEAKGYPEPQCIDPGWSISCEDWEYSNSVETDYYYGCGDYLDWCAVDWITARLKLPEGYEKADGSDPLDLTEHFSPPALPGTNMNVTWILKQLPGYDVNGIPTVVEIFWDPDTDNERGRLIKTLVNYKQSENFQTIVWDGKDEDGNPAPNWGYYTYRRRIGKCSPIIEIFNYSGSGGHEFMYDVSSNCKCETTEEFYRALAERFSPIFAQQYVDEKDFITKFDYDGNWSGIDNEDNFNCATEDCRGHIYYSVVETAHHWFITYADFHPIDFKWFAGHENDMEGLIVGVEKSNKAFGQFLAAATIAHGNYYFATNHWLLDDTEIKPYFIETTNPTYPFLIDTKGSHIIVLVEPKGHGVYPYDPCHYDDPNCDLNVIPGGAQKIYNNHLDPDSDPEKPGDNFSQEFVHYELIDISKSLWPRRDRYEQPIDNFPYDKEFLYSHYWYRLGPYDYIGGSFDGDALPYPDPIPELEDSANPPWGWPEWDGEDAIGGYISFGKGDLFFNPAWVFEEYFPTLQSSGYFYPYGVTYDNHHFFGPTASGLTWYVEPFSADVGQPIYIRTGFKDPNNKPILAGRVLYLVEISRSGSYS